MNNKNEVSWQILDKTDFDVCLDSIQLNRYPKDEETELKIKLSENLKISADEILLTAGGDQLIELFLFYCLKKNITQIGIQCPSFEMFYITSQKMGLNIIKIETEISGELTKESIQLIKENKIQSLILCSPNNPTGLSINKSEIQSFVSDFKGPIMIDQAYLELAENPENVDVLSWSLFKKNIIVLRTFSKAWGLAAARLGYGVAQKEFINELATFRLPFSLNTISLKLGLKILDKKNLIEEKIILFKEKRRLHLNQLGKLPFLKNIQNSDANFIFIELTKDTPDSFLKDNLNYIKFPSLFNQVTWSKNFIRLGFEL